MPSAETIPAVTVPPRPKGLPTASAQSPTRGSFSESLTDGKVLLLSIFMTGDVGALIGADELCVVFRLVVIEGDLDLGCAVDDVVVRHDIAVRRNDEA